MLRRSVVRTLAVLCIVLTATSVNADWNRFRGPNGSGIASGSQPTPVRWSAATNMKWKTALPGAGVSSPIVVGDLVFVTCYSGYGVDREAPGDMNDLKRHVVAIDRADGSVLWSKTIAPVLPEDPCEGSALQEHGYATSTPVSDGTTLYVFFGKTGALAFDLSGKQLWHTDLGKESDPPKWGSAASPILYKDLLIVPAMAESQAMVGLDKKTGQKVWRQEAAGFDYSWTTPVLAKIDDRRTDLVTGVPDEIWGMNPETGALRWYATGAWEGQSCSSFVALDGLVYSSAGRNGTSLAVRAGGQGDVSDSHRVWTGKPSGGFGSPLVYGNRFYMVEAGVFTVADATTGKKVHQMRLKGNGAEDSGAEYSSPIIADGKIYYVRRSGDAFVLEANDSLNQLAVNRLADDEVFSATPAADSGELYIRSNKHLYCVAVMGQSVSPAAVAATARVDEDETEMSGPTLPDPLFVERDADANGKLTGAEIPESLRENWKEFDSDKDGGLSEHELTNGRTVMRDRRQEEARKRDMDARPTRPRRPAWET